MSDALDRVVSARTALVLDEPFFGVLACRLKLVPDPTCKTLWVDGVSLGFSPKFVMDLSHEELKAALVHEVLHVAQGHPWRRGGREQGEWNKACDFAINPLVRDAGYKVGEGWLLDPQYEGKSSEWIYARLPKPQPQEQSQEEQQDEESQEQDDDAASAGTGAGDDGDDDSERNNDAGDDEGEGDGEGADDGEGDGDGDSEGEGDSEPDPSDAGEVRDAPADAQDTGNSEEDWREAVQQAEAVARARGKLPGAAKRVARDARRARVDWESVMLRFAQESSSADYTYRRPNSRYIASGFFLPSLHSTEMGDIVTIIDTSGSIDDVLISQFNEQVQAIKEQLNPRRVVVIYADAEVQRVDVFERDDAVVMNAEGGGGTDFRPAFDAIESPEWFDVPPACAVYLTDLEGVFPPVEPAYPVLWATIKDHAIPFGEKVLIQ